MPGRSLYLIACLFCYVNISSAQFKTDSTWFENYFDRVVEARENKIPSGYDSIELVKVLAQKQNYTPALCRYYIEKAAQLLSKQQTDSAINSYKSAISLAEKEKLNEETGNAYLGLANLYQFNGNTLEAAQCYLKATQYLKTLGRKRTLIGLYSNLYTILNRLQQKNGALQNIRSAVIASNSSETDLVKLINTKTNEEVGFSFPDQTLVKEVGANIIYVIFGNAKFIIRDFKTLASYGSSRDVQRIPAGTLSLIPDFPRNGSLLRELDEGSVFIAKDSMLYPISTPGVLENYGGWDAVYFLPDGALTNFKKSTDTVNETNVASIFNLKQEFDNLTDSIKSALIKNEQLSNDLSRIVAERNSALQKRKLIIWVTVAGVIALLVISFLLYRNLRQRKKMYRQKVDTLEKAKELQQYKAVTDAKEEERNRISQDLHDDLGAGITRIKFLSENISEQLQGSSDKTELSKLKDSANELVEKMSEIIWAMNEKNNSWEDLAFYLRSYAVEYCNENKLNCKFDVPEELPQTLAGGEARRNIFLIMKECLHNIVKHANAKNVFIAVKFQPLFEMKIHDDGKGINLNGQQQNGNGLINIQKRVKNIGGEINISKQDGTLVSFTAAL